MTLDIKFVWFLCEQSFSDQTWTVFCFYEFCCCKSFILAYLKLYTFCTAGSKINLYEEENYCLICLILGILTFFKCCFPFWSNMCMMSASKFQTIALQFWLGFFKNTLIFMVGRRNRNYNAYIFLTSWGDLHISKNLVTVMT